MSKKTTDETSKKRIAKRVVTPKRRYFVPKAGVSVEADDAASAIKGASAVSIKQESGDGR